MKFSKVLFIISILFTLTACGTGIRYQQNLDNYYAAKVVCAQESKTKATVPQTGGAAPILLEFAGPDGCPGMAQPKNEIDSWAPIGVAGISAAGNLLVTYINDRGDRKVVEINAETSRHISDNNLAELEALISAFSDSNSNLTDTNAALTQQVIDLSNEDVPTDEAPVTDEIISSMAAGAL